MAFLMVERKSSDGKETQTVEEEMKKLMTMAALGVLVFGIGATALNAAEATAKTPKNGAAQGLKNGAKNGMAQGLKNGAKNGTSQGLKNGAKNGAKK